MLRNPLVAVHSIFWHDTEVAGRKLGVTLQPLELRGREDFEVAFAAAKQGNAQALLAFARRIAALIGPATSGLNLRQREGIRDEHSFGLAKHPKSAAPVSDLLRRSERQWLYR